MGHTLGTTMTLVVKEREFLHILRVHNTNLNGNATVPFAFTAIKGIGRRYSILCTKKAGIDVTKRAGELSREQVDKIVQTMAEPIKNGVPEWFVNRQKDAWTELRPTFLETTLEPACAWT